MSYVDVVKSALKPNGLFAVTCFVAGGKLGGAELSDWEVYRKLSLNGGLGYTDEKLIRVKAKQRPWCFFCMEVEWVIH